MSLRIRSTALAAIAAGALTVVFGAPAVAAAVVPITGSPISIYVGDLGSDTAARAREILADVPTPNNAVLLAVSPDQAAIEVVYGSQVRGRGAESAAPLGVAAASSAFEQGHLVDGLVSAIRVLSAGISPA